jgi:hypothetical protein
MLAMKISVLRILDLFDDASPFHDIIAQERRNKANSSERGRLPGVRDSTADKALTLLATPVDLAEREA